MKTVQNRETISQIKKYIGLSLLGYSFVFSFLYLLVDILQWDSTVSFIVVYGILYLILYSLQLKLLFKTKHSTTQFSRYCFSLLLFYGLANILYNTFTYFDMNYLIATGITITILFPLRFVVTKYFVYK